MAGNTNYVSYIYNGYGGVNWKLSLLVLIMSAPFMTYLSKYVAVNSSFTYFIFSSLNVACYWYISDTKSKIVFDQSSSLAWNLSVEQWITNIYISLAYFHLFLIIKCQNYSITLHYFSYHFTHIFLLKSITF